jgi:myo-inositol-hexaphosphate 3-phosphohydrolase
VRPRALAGPSSVAALLFGSVALAEVPIATTYSDPVTADQDDMAIWLHPSDLGKSTLIASDKAAGKIVVYDLDGSTVQVIDSPKPGNIDVRHGVTLGGSCADVVALNDRIELAIRIYRVDPESRTLERIDDGSIVTGDNYGFALEQAPDGRLLGYTGAKEATTISQYEITEIGEGMVSGLATGWTFSRSTTIEGMVAHDASGALFAAEEPVGIWRVSSSDPDDATLIAEVGDASGLAADVEGVAIYHLGGGAGYLLASSQGAGKFTVLDLAPPHAPLGEFSLAGVGQTDGIDATSLPLGAAYPQGMFAAHNGAACCPVQAARWQDVAAAAGLDIDTRAWDPRGCTPDGKPPGPGSGGGAGDGASGAGEGGTPGGSAGEAPPGAATDAGAAASCSHRGGARPKGLPQWICWAVLLAATRRRRRAGACCVCNSERRQYPMRESAVWPLPRRPPARPRRHGDGLPRQGGRPGRLRAPGGGEGDASAHRARSRLGADVPRRGAARRAHRPPERRPDARRADRRWRDLHGDGVRRRRLAPGRAPPAWRDR